MIRKLTWSGKRGLSFDCHNYLEDKKVKLAVMKFIDYAIIWWDQLVLNRRRNMERPITTWKELKSIMRKRYIPNHYYRELLQKLENFTQGSRSVEDYHKEMEIVMKRANVQEDKNATMARVLHGLNKDITKVVELQHFVELEDMVYMSMKVERQLTRRSSSKNDYKSSSSWKPWERKGEKKEEKGYFNHKVEPSTKPKGGETKSKNKEGHHHKHSNVKCFKCLGYGHIASECLSKKVMVKSEVESTSDFEEKESPPSMKENDEVKNVVKGEALAIRRAFNVQANEENEE